MRKKLVGFFIHIVEVENSLDKEAKTIAIKMDSEPNGIMGSFFN